MRSKFTEKAAVLCIVLGLLASFRLSAQVQYVYISKNQTATVNQVFDLVKKQTDYHFIYQTDLFKDIPKVNLKKGQIGIKDLLKQMLPADQFDVLIKGKTITIKSIAEKADPLQQEVEELGKVVVTGYQTIDKDRATGSFQILKPKDFNQVASLDLTQRLQGIIPGLSVDKEGNIVIRGTGTFFAETQPLIVVDGFPYMGKIQDLNTEDIAQISVLKDAASTAIYGIRGANGVIVITTKRSNTHGKLQINYTQSLQISRPRLKDRKLMNTKDYIDLEWERYDRGLVEDGPWWNGKTEVGEIYAARKKGSITESQAEEQLDVLRGYNNQRDIERYFYQRRIIQRHYLSFLYGTDKNQFMASMTFDQNQQEFEGNQSENYAFNLKDRFKFNRFVTFSLQSYGNYRKRKNNGIDASTTRPYIKFIDKNGNYIDEAYGIYDLATQHLYESKGLLSFSYNRLQEQRLRDDQDRLHNIHTNFSIEIAPVKWAKWTTSVGYNIKHRRHNDFHHKESYRVRSYINQVTDKDYKRRIPYGNILKYSTSNDENLTLRTQLELKKTFKQFDLNFHGGLERNGFKSERASNNYRFNYDPQSLTESPINYLSLIKGFHDYRDTQVSFRPNELLPQNSKTEDRYLSSFMTGQISYRDKYQLSGSWRLDKTNLFGQSPKYRDQPSWSAGVRWELSKERFFTADFVNRLAIKASYGLAGNVEKKTSPFLIAAEQIDHATGERASMVVNPENPLLGWEKNYTLNAGLDFSLWSNVLSGSLEYYHKSTKDVLSGTSIDPTTGFSYVNMNNGDISNQGIELNLFANVIKSPSFSYDIRFNVTYNHNEVKYVQNDWDISGLIRGLPAKGEPVHYFYGYRYAGLDEQGEPQVYDKEDKIISWKNLDNLTQEDGVFFGTKDPPVYGSFTHAFHWKNLTAEAFFQYSFGHKVQLYSHNDYAFGITAMNFSNNSLSYFAKRWKEPGDEVFTKIPRLQNYADSYVDGIVESDFNIDKGDIIRLKSIHFTYDFTPLTHPEIIKKIGISAGIENLWHWTAADNATLYKRPANFTFGINVQF